MRVLLFLSSTLLFAACLQVPLRHPAQQDPASDPLLQVAEDSLQERDPLLLYADALELERDGEADSALNLLSQAFQQLISTRPEDSLDAQEAQELRVDIARDMLRLSQGLPPDSSEAEGIHSLRFELDQLADSSVAADELDSLIEIAIEPDSLLGREVEELLDMVAEDSLSAYPGIPDADRKEVDQMVDYFTSGKGRGYYEIWMERYALIGPTIRGYLREEGLPEDLVFLAMIESGLKMNARSRVSATGPWQFMAGTARVFKLRVDYWMDERLDLELATRAASRYLRSLYDQYGDWYLAFAAYNWGPGRVNRAIKRNKGKKDYWTLPRMPRETRNYVPTYLAARRVFDEFRDLLPGEEAWQPWIAVDVPGALNVDRLADMLQLEEDEFRSRNPHILRFCTPPDGAHVYAPADMADAFAAKIADLPATAYQDWKRYKIKRGDTLSQIAAGYGVSLRELLRANKLSSRSIIRPGQHLLIPVPKGAELASGGAAKVDEDGRPVHRVRKGENLEGIARSYSIGIQELMAWNHIKNKNRIYAGQRLVLAGPDANKLAMTNAKLPEDHYVVRSGDVAGLVARRHGLSLEELIELNGLDARATIYPGQKLKLRSGAGTTRSINHVVQRGDTLWDLSRRYKVSIDDLRRWNSLSGNGIQPGSTLVIYLSEEG